MRCLTLADMLSKQGVEIHFVCNGDLPLQTQQMITSSGYHLLLSPSEQSGEIDCTEDAYHFLRLISPYSITVIIVDHYGLDAKWERLVRPHTERIVVIDDLANRVHDCDILLDQNLYANLEERYKGLVPLNCELLLGPSNILLRQEFLEYKEELYIRTLCRNVLINFGGSDPTGEILKVLKSIHDKVLFADITFHVIAGPANSRSPQIEQYCSNMPNVVYYEQYKNMAEMLSGIDLVIGAGGISLWERCYMGVPSIVISVADNQVETVRAAESHALCWYLGLSKEVTEEDIYNLLKDIIARPDLLRHSSETISAYMAPLRNTCEHPIITHITS
ncbi:UDP-2,4-diacetamido-2,4,6-trideoxy-beta-L-altropyranose hydrolase [Paenibacillus tarimensis]|nr:UDP-2,4-diacetamido-2,4,6-trideoxy-beta-L-altropyranose hydrolase [Paenibacillus tarimensis]